MRIMTSIGFLGLGNMGRPMAENLVKAGHKVRGFDLSAEALAAFAAAGGIAAASAAEAVTDVEIVVSMLPAGPHVRKAYTAEGGGFDAAPRGALLIDCSPIDVDSARAVAAAASERGFAMIDAPVSGGTGGGAARTPTFMVRGGATAGRGRHAALQGRRCRYGGRARAALSRKDGQDHRPLRRRRYWPGGQDLQQHG